MDWIIDISIYILILNLFAQYLDNFYIFSFSTSVLTAIAMKVMLDILLKLKGMVGTYFGKKDSKLYKFLKVFITFAILFSSKFVVLEVLLILFSDSVVIKGFVSITVLILVLILSRILLERIYISLGDNKEKSI